MRDYWATYSGSVEGTAPEQDREPGPYPLPVAGFTVDTDTPTAGGDVTCTDTSNSGSAVTAWEWDTSDDGPVESTAQNPVLNYPDEGTFTLRLRIFDMYGEYVSTATDVITVGAGGADYDTLVSAESPRTWLKPDNSGSSTVTDYGSRGVNFSLSNGATQSSNQLSFPNSNSVATTVSDFAYATVYTRGFLVKFPQVLPVATSGNMAASRRRPSSAAV